MPTTHLTESDVRRLLNPVDLCAALESAFRDRYPSLSLPPRTHAELAHGISTALYNTAAGLIVAIPSLMFYRYFRGRVDDYLHTLEQSSEQLLTQLIRVTTGRQPGQTK